MRDIESTYGIDSGAKPVRKVTEKKIESWSGRFAAEYSGPRYNNTLRYAARADQDRCRSRRTRRQSRGKNWSGSSPLEVAHTPRAQAIQRIRQLDPHSGGLVFERSREFRGVPGLHRYPKRRGNPRQLGRHRLHSKTRTSTFQ